LRWRRWWKRRDSPFLVVLHPGGRVPLSVRAQRHMPLRGRLVERPTTVRALDQVRVDLVILVSHVLQLWRQVLHRAARCQVPLHGPRGPHVAQQLVVFPAPSVLFLLELLGNPLVLLLALHKKRNVKDISCGLR